MKVLVGFDLVDCNRFSHWSQRSDQNLLKVFSPEEIAYCRTSGVHSASRFAVRFAAREALYKALTPLQYTIPMPFLSLCKSVQVLASHHGSPQLTFNAQALGNFYAMQEIVQVTLSLSHTHHTAGAVIIVTLR